MPNLLCQWPNGPILRMAKMDGLSFKGSTIDLGRGKVEYHPTKFETYRQAPNHPHGGALT